jgi:hypothetical protein
VSDFIALDQIKFHSTIQSTARSDKLFLMHFPAAHLGRLTRIPARLAVVGHAGQFGCA